MKKKNVKIKSAREDVFNYLDNRSTNLAKKFIEAGDFSESAQRKMGEKLGTLLALHPRYRELTLSDQVQLIANFLKKGEQTLGIQPNKESLN